jgi:hypothetical protein
LGSKFSAADASLGYAYQVRIALMRALELARKGLQFEVAIETLDDVSFAQVGGDPFELLQLKHSIQAKAGLSDASPALWKTLRIWSTKWREGQLTDGTSLFLVTTSLAADGSAAAYLKSDSRDYVSAQGLLDTAASTSLSQENAAAYEAWKALTSAQRASLLQQIEVIDAAPNIIDLESRLVDQLWGFVEKERRDSFLEYLEGWWFRRVLKQLAGEVSAIPVAELEAQLDKLREQFRKESLPIDEALLTQELDEALANSYRSHVFVRQLELVKASANRISFAIRDYFRAYEQRSKWVRHDLVLDIELRGYERQLIEEWQLAREQLLARIGADATDEVLQATGLELLAWAENSLFPIRIGVTAPFVCRGSFQMLADERRVGWHPKFLERLTEILQQTKVAVV